ncbi:MAG: ATP-binding protein [Anaerolineae bacterium]
MGHPEFGKITPCQCRTEQLSRKRLGRLRVISNLQALGHYTFDTFRLDVHARDPVKNNNLTVAYREAQDFAQNPSGWLVLLGGYGCGKTHLAVAIANYCIQHGQAALFVVVPDLLDHLRATYGPHSASSYDERFEQIRSAPLLILDDLGTQASTPWAQEKLFQLFNHRYNARLPTVITSNHSLDEIDRRLRSRLVDPDLSRVAHIMVPDFRGGGETFSELSTLSQHADKIFETFDLRIHELDREKAENLRQAFNFAKNYAREPEGWILFTGPYGCGKTHLAAAIANAWSQREQEALFIVVPDLLDHLRAAFSPTALTPYDKRFEEVRNTPLLVLDDLGTQSATPWAQEKLYQLFNHRYNARLPTVITMADVSDLDPRLKSRLLDVGRCTPIAISVGSFRGSITQQTKSGPKKRRSTAAKRKW